MVDRINRFLSLVSLVISGGAFFFMTVIAFVDAIGRQFRHPVLGASEYVSLALITFFFGSLALVVRDDSQIRVGLLVDFYKPRLAIIERYFWKIPVAPWLFASAIMCLVAVWFGIQNLINVRQQATPPAHSQPEEE